MSARKYSLQELAQVRNWVLGGENFLLVSDNVVRENYADAVRAYFKAFGEKVKVVEFEEDKLYIKMEK